MSLEFAPEPIVEDVARRPARSAGVAGWGAALPATVVPNAAISEEAGVTPEWIVKRTGISERRHLAPGERLDALCAQAGREALAQAGLDGAALDAVLVATSTADDVFPQTAPVVAGMLGADHALNWDVGIACTGFVAGLAQGAALIESGRAENVLLIGADAVSRCIDPSDRGPAALFADGAGAAVLTRGGEGRVGAAVMGSDGASAHFLVASRENGVIRMEGQEVFKHAIARMAESSREVLAREGLAVEDIALVVPHQANGRITTALALRLGLTPEQVVDDIADRGNTSAGTIPLALHRAAGEGRLPERGHVLLVAFGAGFSWGATVLHYGGAA
ncbi:MAG: 3-oxoacyl-[acyl-carrier-protein] synthase, KASIII [uncultured Solirubrobacteraceae bacterium]|uniref:3-oxoacyl-[acyl-carrier-protein] synthase, KASIII n=1 Tax=uncultured Solirubrobacteraceae bacterium TaxID=1162706 RepID=A0A6J4SZE1_9ACTN|nr:MAG: 3-oxoacyl-[acyl-carrier-protein] synthase, KASIII [uncultured Solirubrobacteraceae bacterium]